MCVYEYIYIPLINNNLFCEADTNRCFIKICRNVTKEVWVIERKWNKEASTIFREWNEPWKTMKFLHNKSIKPQLGIYSRKMKICIHKRPARTFSAVLTVGSSTRETQVSVGSVGKDSGRSQTGQYTCNPSHLEEEGLWKFKVKRLI